MSGPQNRAYRSRYGEVLRISPQLIGVKSTFAHPPLIKPTQGGFLAVELRLGCCVVTYLRSFEVAFSHTALDLSYAIEIAKMVVLTFITRTWNGRSYQH
jgi:hypothetical protein